MRRAVPALLATLALGAASVTAAGGDAPAAAPFQEVRLEDPPRRSHRLAYALIAAGVALGATSFVLADRANASYDRYLASTDPAEIERAYDRTVYLDRWALATLLGGEGLVAAGLYLRFIHRQDSGRLRLALGARRCAVSCRLF